MPTYKVTAHVTVSAYAYVRAATPEEAKAKAAGMECALAQYGAGRGGENPAECFLIEDADGSPEGVVVDGEADDADEWFDELYGDDGGGS